MSESDPPDPAAPRDERRRRALRWLAPLLALAGLAAALLVLHHELRAVSYHAIAAAMRDLPRARLAAALGLTALAFCVLPAYDALALRYVRRRLPVGQTVLASVIAYAFSQNVGFAVLTGGSVRYRFWSAWGLSAPEIAAAVAFSALTFWIGICTVGGAALLVAPLPDGAVAASPALLRAVALVAVAAVAAYLAANVRWRGRTVQVRQWTLHVPGPRLALAQVAVSALDWTFAGTVAYTLLPRAPGLGLPTFLGAFVLAQVIALASHVPGGVGVLETLLVLMLRPYLGATEVLASLVAYRVVYYLLPFAVALLLLVGHEVAVRRAVVGAAALRTGALAARWIPAALPSLLGAATFAAGAILLVSGATPPERDRIAALDRALPLALIELSHFAGSVVGACLLVLGWAIRRRLDAAYALTLALLGVGIAASLLKGFDWEEALALAAVLAVVAASRRAFYRRAALAADPLSPGWVVAVVAVVGASVWLGLFSYRHVEYGADLWWSFAARADAPRFLRATAGAGIALLVIGLARLLRYAEAEPALPSPAELDRAAAIAARAPDSTANLALLGDKALLFADGDAGFVMYGVAGRSWVALGDPVGPPAVQAELAWLFREAADHHGAWPAFYEVSAATLPLYLDMGLTLLKLGEEARVPLADFGLEGSARRALRRAHRDVAKRGATMAMVPAAELAPLLPELRAVSDAWLAGKRTREKGFSLGRFDEAYLRRFPVAVVRVDDRIVAFANVWCAAPGTELSVDLMRYAPDAAPPGVMEYLFVELMLWGRAQRYATFNLGMAPLSGFEQRTLAPLWNRAGDLVFRHAEHFYNFQGLRTYKEKYDPVWSPRYLASPGGLALPRILVNAASLISGGLRGTVTR